MREIMFRENIVENRNLLVILILIGIMLFSVGLVKNFTWDEAQHANVALFYKNFFWDWIKNPVFSFDDIIDYAADYHSHYKFLTAAIVYPPLHATYSSSLAFALGDWVLQTKLLVILEALVLLFFLFKTAELFTKEKKYPLLCVFFLALHPVFIDIATRNYLDVGLGAATMAMFYFLIRFLRWGRPRALWGAFAWLGIGILIKPIVAIPFLVVILILLLEGKFHTVFKNRGVFLKGILALLLTTWPIIFHFGFLYSQGLSDMFISKWSGAGSETAGTGKWLPSMETGEPVWAWSSHEQIYQLHSYGAELTDFQEFTKNISAFLFQWYMIPFFLVGLLYFARNFTKRGHEVEKIAILMMVLTLYLFTVRFHVDSLKHIVIALPFVIMVMCFGLIKFFDTGIFKRLSASPFVLVLFLLSASAVQSGFYLDSVTKSPTTADFEKSASIVIDDIRNSEGNSPSTVLTTFGQIQMFYFALADSDRVVYTMYMPTKAADIERAVAGDFSYYSSYDAWERFGVRHPEPRYLIVHEKRLELSVYDYGVDYFSSRPNEFELMDIIDGKVAGDRTFIYKIAK